MFDESEQRTYCDAGRLAFFGGRWSTPCPADIEAAGRVHVIYAVDPAAGPVKIELCDRHFDEVNRAGQVTEPYAGRDTVRERIGREPD